MIVLIFICSGFYRLAVKRALNGVLWAVIAGASYFAGQFLAVFIFALFDTYTLSFEAAAYGISIGGGIVGVLITWYVLEQVAKRKASEKAAIDGELLDDDQYLERL
ncbi:hypothetical protein [Crocinitomix algicola]|uniref:hypothetical protein n=1 Tax=Crocinitomix algicola TaxID=1740263 RepID=UPI00082D366A|nr:hypothetical protein [Crocinitomix algicola]